MLTYMQWLKRIRFSLKIKKKSLESEKEIVRRVETFLLKS